jgi:hypothetical protein
VSTAIAQARASGKCLLSVSIRYVWSSVLVSSALSVFMRESPRELAAHVHGKGTELHGCTCASSPDYGDTPTARLELSHGEAMSTAATHGEPNAAGDELKVAAEKGLASCAKVSTCQQQQLGAVGDGGTVLADGRSLVNAAAGSSFVKHVLSKGNSESVWQGFLNFIGKLISLSTQVLNSHFTVRWPFRFF